MFFFQYYCKYTLSAHASRRHNITVVRGISIHIAYLNCISHDGLTILDNEAELRVVGSQRQTLRANAASDIDNQRTLWKASPAVP
jgi:hypothetical protein